MITLIKFHFYISRTLFSNIYFSSQSCEKAAGLTKSGKRLIKHSLCAQHAHNDQDILKKKFFLSKHKFWFEFLKYSVR